METTLTLSAAILLIASAIAPWIVALFKRDDMSDTRKRLIAGIVATVLGSIVAVATGQITGIPQGFIDWLAWLLLSVGVVISLAQGFYKQWQGATNSITAKLTKE